MKRGSPTPTNKVEGSGSSFAHVSVDDQPPVPAIPKKNRELEPRVSPLNFSSLPNNELNCSRTKLGGTAVRNLGLTTNRSGQIVQSGTIHRAATNTNSLARNKSSEHLVQQPSTPSSLSPTVLSGTLTKNTMMDSGQERSLSERRVVKGNDGRSATLDRSWRTKEADLSENLPHVGGSFSFDLDRDVQELLDMITTFEGNGVDGGRLNSPPVMPVFDGDQMTVRRVTTQQNSSPGDRMRFQGVVCDGPEFDAKTELSKKGAIENLGFNANQTSHRKFYEASVKSQEIDAGLKESHRVAIGASKIHTAPSWTQEIPYDITEINRTPGFSKKFSVSNDHPPGYSPSRKGALNGAMEAGYNGVPYDHHKVESLMRSVSSSGGHNTGVSAQRGYASDSEDQMDWLQQQKAKLKTKLSREVTKLDPRLLQELKIRQMILGRTPVDEKERLVDLCSSSTDRAQESNVAVQRPESHHTDYGHRIPTPDLHTDRSGSYPLRQIHGQVIGGSDGRLGTPEFHQNCGGYFANGTQSPGHGNRSMYTNGVPISSCSQSYNGSTHCDLNPTRTTHTNSESVEGTKIRPSSSSSGQREVNETCISKKISHQHRGYSPTRLDALMEAAAVRTDSASSPSSSRSVEISDSGYRTTTSASSTTDESPLTSIGPKTSNISVQKVLRTPDGQEGFEVNMALSNFRLQATAADSSSKTNEKFNLHNRLPTVANQMDNPGTIAKQPRFPASDSHQFFTTAQKTLEEEIDNLAAFGEQLKQNARPTESQLPPQDQRRPLVGVQEPPFVYTAAVKSSNNVFHGNPMNLTEEQKQILRLTENRVPVSRADNPVLNARRPMNGNPAMDQSVRTTTGLPTETRIFNQLHVETHQPNGMLVEPSDQRQESQPTNGDRDKAPGLRAQDLFVRLPTSKNNHTNIPNSVTMHQTVNRERYVGRQSPVNQQVGAGWSGNGAWSVEKDATTVQGERAHLSGKPPNANAVPNYAGTSGNAFQGHKIAGSESAAVFNGGFENQSSVRSGEAPWISQGNHECVVLYSEDGHQVLIPRSCLDSTMVSVPSRSAIPGHLIENLSSSGSKDSTALTLQQVRSDGQMIDRYGVLIAPDSYTIRRQMPCGSVQQQPVGATARVETVRSGSLPHSTHSANDEAVQRGQFYSQNSDSVFASPPPASVSMKQVAGHLRGEISRTSSFSSSVTGQSSPSLSVDRSSGGSASSNRVADGVDVSPQYVMQCVRDAFKEWYKPEMTRDEVVNFLKDKPPGTFIIRNSTSYVGDFALAVKVSEIPLQIQQKTGDMSEEFVRHFLIESKPSGIRLKGRSNEPVFASLTSFVFQHALTPLSLPHRLLLPSSTDTSSVSSGTGSVSRSSTSQSTSKAQDETSSMLIYIGSVELETLTGPEALEKAISQTEAQKTTPAMTTTIVNFILSSQGIVLTDTKRKLFFRRHYPLSCISYFGVDAKERRWTEEVEGSKKNTDRRIFGFVSRKRGSSSAGDQSSPVGNECHLFADYETGYPANSVVDLINKILAENGYNVMK